MIYIWCFPSTFLCMTQCTGIQNMAGRQVTRRKPGSTKGLTRAAIPYTNTHQASLCFLINYDKGCLLPALVS